MADFDSIRNYAKILSIDYYAEGLAQFCYDSNLSAHDISIIESTMKYLSEKKTESVVNTLLKMSRLPLKNPKTFDSFDFTRIHGKDVERLTSLPSLSAVYAHKNLAFIGPQGVGKTHLAMAFARACCEKGMKSYFLKASELNQKFTDARKYDRVGSTINALVKPSCLVIDEIGRCVFDKENTRMFFDLIDRRYSKEGSNCIIFTSNKQPESWQEFFSEDSSLQCSLDRIFDDASVFIIKGESYRGRKLETIKLEAGNNFPQASVI